MRRIVVAVMGTVSGLVLLFSYHTSTNATETASAPSPTGTGPTGTPPTGTTPTGTTPTGTTPTGTDPQPSVAPTTPAAAAPATSGTFTGSAVDTRWGVVQVAVTVAGGKVSQVEAVQYPQNNGRDREINAYALPVLAQEATQAQSAKIDAVSGATVTSDGYIQSLQSALDQAHL